MATQPAPRVYPVVYGGWIGALIALLVLIACFVLWIVKAMDSTQALLFGGLAIAILLR